jgi:hypothetical protein
VSDLSSPGFVVQILARTPDVRLGVFGRPVQAILSRPGVILARMTDQTMRVEKFEYIDADRDLGSSSSRSTTGTTTSSSTRRGSRGT